jgi:hypothetical protein
MSRLKVALRFALLAIFAGFLPHVVKSQGNSTKDPNNILFILQDKVTRFDVPGGVGLQVGTAMGKINGVSITTFKYDFSAFPSFSVNKRTGISDTDGDQIIFKVIGSGQFLLPLVDPTVPGDSAAPPTQVLGGTGGPFSGTYEVVATSGKYSKTFSLGQKFPFKAVGYNPSPASAGTDFFGAVYVEVFAH